MNSRTDRGISSLLARLMFFAGLWWLLNGGDARSWIVGGPVVLAAAALSLRLRPEQAWRWHLAGMLPMAWSFLRESVRGGFDVARRAMRPCLPLDPGLLRFHTGLPVGTARLFFAGIISLRPGTLVLGFEKTALRIHALDADPVVEADLRALEQRVAALFGIQLGTDGEAGP